jgi:hypothetical protein
MVATHEGGSLGSHKWGWNHGTDRPTAILSVVVGKVSGKRRESAQSCESTVIVTR